MHAEQLNVGVGALAGSTIMVLTIAWFLSVLGGRVNIDANTKKPRYKAPKLDPPANMSLHETGVALSPSVNIAARTVLISCATYLLIQIPGLMYLNATPEVQSAGEKNWAYLALIVCICNFMYYLYDQYRIAQEPDGTAVLSRDEFLRNSIANGTVTLAGVMVSELAKYESSVLVKKGKGYQASERTPLNASSVEISKDFLDHLGRILRPFFQKYDVDNSGTLDLQEIQVLINKDMGERLSTEKMVKLFKEFDTDNSGSIDYEEFVQGVAKYIYVNKYLGMNDDAKKSNDVIAKLEDGQEEKEEEEKEEVPEDIANLSPAEQQVQIKWRAFWMMAIGSIVVLLISDPMVDVLSEIGNRTGIPSFYVAFVLAPVASNLTELIAAYNYAQKKTLTSISVSLATLEGAAVMNNTFVLGVFMALICVRGLVWEFFAETSTILVVQILIVLMAMKSRQTLFDALMILALYPLSLALVAGLESMGWN